MQNDFKTNFSETMSQIFVTHFQKHIPQEISIFEPTKGTEGFYRNDRVSSNTALINKEKMAMYERAAQLHKLLVTWILVADSKRAQIYECHKIMRKTPLGGANKHHYYDEKSGHTLIPVQNGVTEAESIDDYQTGHDRRGTTSSSNSPTHNTYDPSGDIGEELKRRFTKTIAGKLQRACVDNSFDRLVLVASAKMIGDLKSQLKSEVQDRIVCIVPKDLARYQNHIVMNHIRDTLAGFCVE